MKDSNPVFECVWLVDEDGQDGPERDIPQRCLMSVAG